MCTVHYVLNLGMQLFVYIPSHCQVRCVSKVEEICIHSRGEKPFTNAYRYTYHVSTDVCKLCVRIGRNVLLLNLTDSHNCSKNTIIQKYT